MKKLVIVVAIIALAVGGTLFWLASSLDGIVKRQIEVVGSKLTGTKVRVGAVRIRLAEATGEISDLSIANPPGYNTEDAFHLGKLHLRIDVGSIRDQPLVLDELVIKQPRVSFEIRADGNTNLQTISDHIAANVKSAGAETASSGHEGQPLRIRVGKLVIRDAAYLVRSPAEQVDGIDGMLPALVLSNVGGSKGATPAELGKIVLGELVRRVVADTARSRIGAAIGKKLEEKAAKGIGDSLKQMFH